MTEPTLETLYARSSTGKIKQWRVWTQGPTIITEHGFVDGKKQTKPRTVKGKNLGKSNETTPKEQAVLEAQSKWNKQLDKGYVTDPDGIPDEGAVELFLPMLAHSFEKKSHKVIFPCHVQPKLNGVRCLARKKDGGIVFWSRKAKYFNGLDEIAVSLAQVLKEGQVVDGELYVHGWSFQKIISAVKKRRDDTKVLEYHLYDAPSPKEFADRCKDLSALRLRLRPAGIKNLKIVDTSYCADKEAIDRIEELAVELKYEGVMVRNAAGLYKYGHRSEDLLKIKRFVDGEFEIIGGKECEGDPGTVTFRVKDTEGKEFDVRPVGTHEERSVYWKTLESLLGKMLTVKYQELSEAGIPMFPVGLVIRDYE